MWNCTPQANFLATPLLQTKKRFVNTDLEREGGLVSHEWRQTIQWKETLKIFYFILRWQNNVAFLHHLKKTVDVSLNLWALDWDKCSSMTKSGNERITFAIRNPKLHGYIQYLYKQISTTDNAYQKDQRINKMLHNFSIECCCLSYLSNSTDDINTDNNNSNNNTEQNNNNNKFVLTIKPVLSFIGPFIFSSFSFIVLSFTTPLNWDSRWFTAGLPVTYVVHF